MHALSLLDPADPLVLDSLEWDSLEWDSFEWDSFEWDSFEWAGTLPERLPSKQFDEHRLGVVLGIEVVLTIGVALGVKIA